MKTAAIVYEFPSHSETFVHDQIAGLIELGCDVRIYADGPDPVATGFGGKDAELFSDRVKYFGLPFKGLRESAGRWKSTRPPPPLNAGISPRVEPAITTRLRLRFEGRAFSAAGRFDVIHSHFGPNGARAVRLRRIGLVSGPVLTSFYGYDVGRESARRGYRELFRDGERFIALSNHMRETLIGFGCPADRTIVHRLGTDVDRFRARARQSGKRLEIISIARLVPKKGIDVGIRAVAKAAKEGHKLHYTIVGGGYLRRRLEKVAFEEGVSDIVTFAGPQPRDVVANLLGESDVLLAPSVTALDGDAEGTPVAILEAAASGLPVVSTIHAGIPEIVDQGRSGFLVPERNVGEMADRLCELSENPALRNSMGDAGRQAVLERHNQVTLNRDLLRIYDKLAGQA